jgi:seryl-tRNA(Sec) selenium transferase
MSLKLRPVINAAGTMTKYGGSRMFPKAVEAMAEASTLFLDIDMLLQESGSY